VDAVDAVRRETDAPVFMHPADAEGKVRDYEPLEDGQAFDAAGLGIRVFHTPGHSPGSVTFVIGTTRSSATSSCQVASAARTSPVPRGRRSRSPSARSCRSGKRRHACTRDTGRFLTAVEELRTNPYLPPGL
jgi:hypothetical protein